MEPAESFHHGDAGESHTTVAFDTRGKVAEGYQPLNVALGAIADGSEYRSTSPPAPRVVARKVGAAGGVCPQGFPAFGQRSEKRDRAPPHP